MTHLNEISKVYMEKVATKPDFLDLDKDGNKKEPMKKAAVEAPKERLKTDRDGYRVPKKDADAARERLLAKARAKRAEMSEALDPVGKEDDDIDNDGKKNTKKDKYLTNRRRVIGNAIANEACWDTHKQVGMKKKGGKMVPDCVRKEETEITEIHSQAHTPHEVPSKDLEKLVKKAVKRIDADVDGDVDTKDPKETEMGEFVPTPDGKGKLKTIVRKEGFSNWRSDLIEVMGSEEKNQKVTEKKVNNSVKTSAMGSGLKLGEAIEEIGGTLIEMVEDDDMSYIVEGAYEEFLSEGYSEEEIEEAIEYALNEVSDSYYDDAVKSGKKKARQAKRQEMMRVAKGRLKYLRRKAGKKVSAAKEKIGAAKKAATYASAKAQVAAYNKGREVSQTVGDKVRTAKTTVSNAPQKVKSGVKSFIKKQAEKVVDRMSEEVDIEEGIGMTVAKALGNPPPLSAKMRLKQSLLNREIKKNTAKSKKKSYTNVGASNTTPANEEVELLDEMPYQVMGYDKEGKKEKKVGKPVKSKKYADARAAELEDTHKKTGGKYRSQYVEEVENIEEKSLSRAQQRFMGMVYAAKNGETPASPEVAKAASGMSKKAAKDFAKTKHEGLPEKKEVKENMSATMNPLNSQMQKDDKEKAKNAEMEKIKMAKRRELMIKLAALRKGVIAP